MIKHVFIIISATLAFSTPAFCQDHAAAEALNNLAAAINNYEAGLGLVEIHLELMTAAAR